MKFGLPLSLPWMLFAVACGADNAESRTPSDASADAGGPDAALPAVVVSWDFEDPALPGWTREGGAFEPAAQPAARKRFSPAPAMPLGGTYWRDTYEIGGEGERLVATTNAETGSLTSAEHVITAEAPYVSFLVGGGDDEAARVECQVDGRPMFVARGQRLEGMRRVVWDAREHIGRPMRVRIVDESTVEWGHLQVDDFRFHASDADVARPAPLWGFADLHTHSFAYLGYGGDYFSGRAFDPTCTAADGPECQLQRSLPSCGYAPGGGPDADTIVEAFLDPARRATAASLVERALISPALALSPDLVQALAVRERDLFDDIQAGIAAADPETGAALADALGAEDLLGFLKTHPDLAVAVCMTGEGVRHGPFGCADLLGEVNLPGGLHANDGWPTFGGWPTFRTMSHQQFHVNWMKRAWQGGLRVLVMDAVSNELICELDRRLKGLPVEGPSRCADMDTVEAQIAAARALERYIADNDGGWYRIVTSPTEARAAVEAGHLAVVLGIEVDALFGCSRPERCGGADPAAQAAHVTTQLERFHALGVRKIIPVHLADNEFGGMAVFNEFFTANSYFLTGKYMEFEDCSAEGVETHLSTSPLVLVAATVLRELGLTDGFRPPPYPAGAHCNKRGLTDTGRHLVREMMRLGMVIDVEHMSIAAMDDTVEEAEAHGKYPLAASHTGLMRMKRPRDSMTAETGPSERDKTERAVEQLRAGAGIVGVGLSHPALPDGAGGDTPCDGSSVSWVRLYMAVVDAMGGPAVARVGVGSDLNGLAGLPGPRFGPDGCFGARADPARREAQQGAQSAEVAVRYVSDGAGEDGALVQDRAGERTFDISTDGMAHGGMYPDFLEEASRVGLTEDYRATLFRSAEDFVKVWELGLGLAAGAGAR